MRTPAALFAVAVAPSPLGADSAVLRQDFSARAFLPPDNWWNRDIAAALPMGARLRLKASFDISGYPVEVRRLLQAMKTYGLIVADNGSDLHVSGTMDPRWDNDVPNPAFDSVHANDFEVIRLGWGGPP